MTSFNLFNPRLGLKENSVEEQGRIYGQKLIQIWIRIFAMQSSFVFQCSDFLDAYEDQLIKFARRKQKEPVRQFCHEIIS